MVYGSKQFKAEAKAKKSTAPVQSQPHGKSCSVQGSGWSVRERSEMQLSEIPGGRGMMKQRTRHRTNHVR